MRTIRAITFDFWMTLFREDNRRERHELRVNAFSDATGVDPDRISDALQKAHAEFFRVHAAEQRTLAPGDAVAMVCNTLELTLDARTTAHLTEVFGTAIFAFPPVPIPGALEAVQAAAARGPVGLISDSGMSPGTSLRTLLDNHGFTPYFSALTFSDEVGVSKPQTPMFAQTAAALNVAPDALFHLGDLEPTDIVGVQAVGGMAGLFAGANDRFAATTNAEHTFHTWQAFLAWLPELDA